MFYAYRTNGKIRAMYSNAGQPRSNLSSDIEILAPIPPDIAKEDFEFLQAVQATDEFGETYWVISVDQAAKMAADDKKLKDDTKKNLKNNYVSLIESEMLAVFGTIERSKATSLYLTWLMMESNPGFYSDKGLLNDKGQALDTNTKVFDYATDKIMRALDYSVLLIKEEQKLAADIAALG